MDAQRADHGVSPRLSDYLCDGYVCGAERGGGEDADVEPDGRGSGDDAGGAGHADYAVQRRMPVRRPVSCLRTEMCTA
jgi:hypothetical protein